MTYLSLFFFLPFASLSSCPLLLVSFWQGSSCIAQTGIKPETHISVSQVACAPGCFFLYSLTSWELYTERSKLCFRKELQCLWLLNLAHLLDKLFLWD